MSDSMIRLLACLILAGIIAIFTLIVPIKENGRIQEGRHRPGHAGVITDGYERKKGSSKGFSRRGRVKYAIHACGLQHASHT